MNGRKIHFSNNRNRVENTIEMRALVWKYVKIKGRCTLKPGIVRNSDAESFKRRVVEWLTQPTNEPTYYHQCSCAYRRDGQD